ncbi:MAG: hypothetical protein OXT67_00110 [Zetaproteobacteria bacterium]|nr:hypothetical protein [Zetaproteobacteria bacterium]
MVVARQTQRKLCKWVVQGFLSILLLSLFGCRVPLRQSGSLLVSAVSEGAFEVYSFDGSYRKSITSERVGHFNQPLQLPVGHYIILADCSFQEVLIEDGKQTKVVAHHLVYQRPALAEKAKFLVRCRRYPPTGIGQQILNRFELDVLANMDEVLAGMQGGHLEHFSAASAAPVTEPVTRELQLASVRVSVPAGYSGQTGSYFLVSQEESYTQTISQKLDEWLLLMPGKYQAFLNGTRKQIELVAGEQRDLVSGSVEFIPPVLPQALESSHLASSAPTLTLDGSNQLQLQRPYLVLPGDILVSVTGSQEVIPLHVEPNQQLQKHLRGVVVHSGCAPYEWSCFAQREVVLHFAGKNHPFYEARSDRLLLFAAKNIEIGLEGSKGIRRRVSQEKDFSTYTLGTVEVVPIPTYSKDHVTDLLRLDVAGAPFVGFSYDVLPDRVTVFTLLTGKYLLSRYTTLGGDGERLNYSQFVSSQPGQEVRVEIPVYVKEAQAPRYRKLVQKMEQGRQARRAGKWGDKLLPMF